MHSCHSTLLHLLYNSKNGIIHKWQYSLNVSHLLQSEGCALNKFFISFNMILCIVVSVVAILPKVQEYQPRSGLLQSSVVSLYTLYLTWSAMSNQPGKNLNIPQNAYKYHLISTLGTLFCHFMNVFTATDK